MGGGGGGGVFVNMDLLLNSASLIHGQHTLNGSQTLTQFFNVWAWLLSVSPPPHCIGIDIRGPLANAQDIRGYELRSPYTWVQCTHSLVPRPRFPTAADRLHHHLVESGLDEVHFPSSSDVIIHSFWHSGSGYKTNVHMGPMVQSTHGCIWGQWVGTVCCGGGSGGTEVIQWGCGKRCSQVITLTAAAM